MAKQKNPLLKSANEEHEYTLEHIKELQKCQNDPVYFVKTYCQIQHPKHGSVPFKLYPYQEEMLRAYKDNRQVVVLSARQTGKCFLPHCNVTLVKLSINIIKRFILWIINRRVYNELFKNL